MRLFIGCLLLCLTAVAGAQPPVKSDLLIYDRPNWNSYTYNYPILGGVQIRDHDEIVVRFDTANADKINDDFFVEEYQQVVLSSKDMGKTWTPITPNWSCNIPLELSDGTQVDVVHAMRLQTRQQQKQRLTQLGIGHIWNDRCHMSWDFWPQSRY